MYNLHGFSCQEKVSRFRILLIPRYGTSLAVSHWKLRMVLMVEYRSSRLDQNKPFSGPVSTLLSPLQRILQFQLVRSLTRRWTYYWSKNKPFSGPVSTLLSSSADFTVSACPVAYAPLDLLLVETAGSVLNHKCHP